MNKTISGWEPFKHSWNGVINFLMAGALTAPFDYPMPPIERIVDVLRHDPDTRITSGMKGDTLDLLDMTESFRQLPLEQALLAPFSLAHFVLDKFYGKDQLLEGFEERVMLPWNNSLHEAGFTWTKSYPIFFLSGPHCATNYHMDYSHVVAWQTHGVKLFSGLKDPEYWAPLDIRIHSRGVRRPEGIRAEDVLTYEMKPGMVLWNAFLTPHWVETTDHSACSINIAIDGLRLGGELCRHEEEIEQWKLSESARKGE